MRTWLLAVVLVLASACQAEPQPGNAAPPERPAAQAAAEAETSPISGLPVIALQIRSAGRTHNFRVEVARTGEEQAYGLMNRTALGDAEGMLFPFGTPRPASFWMKNTLIPLDMLFVRADGTIARIAAMTTPHSLEGVSSGEPVAAVLELRGGRAAELGITESARVSWPGGPR